MKKKVVSTFASVAALICAATTTPVTAQAATSPRWGDVNDDGVVTVEDAQEILQYYATVVLAENQWSGDFNLQIADVDLVEGVSVEDAQYVLQKYVAETLAAKTYLLPVEFSAEQTEDSRVLCTNESGWYVWSEKSNSISSHIIDVVREGELFEILQKDESTWYQVKMSSGKIGYMNISSSEFSNYFVYTRKSNATEQDNQTTTETTTTAATTSASETTTSEEVSTESKAETTTTSAATTTTTKATTESTSTTPETTTTTVSTTSKEETTTTTTTSETTTLTTVVSTTTTVETTTAAQTTTSPFEEVFEKFEVGDVIEFTMTAWKVYDDTYEKVIAWAPNGTRFTIKEVHDLKGGDSKENQQVYLVEFEKQGEKREGYIFNGPEGFFKKVEAIDDDLQKKQVFEKFEVGDVIEFTMTSWKVYNGDFSVVLAWIQNGTRFTIEEVHNLSGGDSKVDQEVYYVSFEKDGKEKHGYIFSGPIGYFKKIDSEK